MKRWLTMVVGIALLLPTVAMACGMGLVSKPNGWDYGADSAEQAFIDYQNGTERLLISRTFESDKATVWIVPLPARPDDIKLDVLAQIPHFSGNDIRPTAHASVSQMRDGMLMTQLYPAVYIVAKALTHEDRLSADISPTLTGINSAFRTPGSKSVTVYDHLEKEGFVSETLRAENGEALYQYLKAKGLSIKEGSLPVLDEYIGRDFTFVASWVNPVGDQRNQLGGNTKGLLMTFPTSKIFYPLHPGSIYSGNGLPETIYVTGHITPHVYADIANETEINYYQASTAIDGEGFLPGNQATTDLYTKIVITARPESETEDLYMTPNAPTWTVIIMTILHNPLIVFLVSLVSISMLASGIAGKMVYKKDQIFGRMALLGVFNCFTIIGLAFASRKDMPTKQGQYLVYFSLIFLAITIGVFGVVTTLLS